MVENGIQCFNTWLVGLLAARSAFARSRLVFCESRDMTSPVSCFIYSPAILRVAA